MSAPLFTSDAPVVEPRLDHARTEIARLANRARARLLRSGTAVTIDVLADAQAKRPATVRQWVARQRRKGELVTVTHDGVVLIPTFQLDRAFDLDPDIAGVVAELVGHGMDGWSVWDWAHMPNSWLDGHTPSEALAAGHLREVRRAVAGLFQE